MSEFYIDWLRMLASELVEKSKKYVDAFGSELLAEKHLPHDPKSENLRESIRQLKVPFGGGYISQRVAHGPHGEGTEGRLNRHYDEYDGTVKEYMTKFDGDEESEVHGPYGQATEIDRNRRD